MNRKLTYAEIEAFLTNPESRIVDSRMLEISDDFSTELQVLLPNGDILSCTENHEKGLAARTNLFRLQYQNNPRNNPGLYGLLDGVKNDGQ